ncbi:MAG: hypothetical protein OXN18_15415 [Gemmatimonadota bacterium]|nr:hypothetical protein [Gemmatimonadota bacterium]
MTFRRWLSRLRPEHIPFGLGVLVLLCSLFIPAGGLSLFLELTGLVAVSSAVAVAAASRELRRDIRVLWDDLPPRIADAVIERRLLELKKDPPTGAIHGSSHPTSKEEHQ